METLENVTQILEQLSGAVQEKSRLGRSERPLFWINPGKIAQVARAIKTQAGFDLLENLSAMQVGDEIVLSYFVRKSDASDFLVLRTGIAPAAASGASGTGAEEWVEQESVSSEWPMARSFEAEISQLFGVKFSGQSPRKEWDGFPLRKTFVMGAGVSP